jgi:hypothetical protein
LTRSPFTEAAFAAFPRAHDADRLARGFERWMDEAARHADSAPDLADFMRNAAADDAPARRILEACFGNSPFLCQCLLREPAVLRRVIEDGPDAALAEAFDTVRNAVGTDLDSPRVMRALRIAKRQVALIAALGDMSQVWPLTSVTGALTDYADLSLNLTTAHLLRQGAAEGHIELAHPVSASRLGLSMPLSEVRISGGIFLLSLTYCSKREISERVSTSISRASPSSTSASGVTDAVKHSST